VCVSVCFHIPIVERSHSCMTGVTRMWKVERCHRLHVKCIFLTSSQLAKDLHVLMYVHYDMQEGSPQKTPKKQSKVNI